MVRINHFKQTIYAYVTSKRDVRFLANKPAEVSFDYKRLRNLDTLTELNICSKDFRTRCLFIK